MGCKQRPWQGVATPTLIKTPFFLSLFPLWQWIHGFTPFSVPTAGSWGRGHEWQNHRWPSPPGDCRHRPERQQTHVQRGALRGSCHGGICHRWVHATLSSVILDKFSFGEGVIIILYKFSCWCCGSLDPSSTKRSGSNTALGKQVMGFEKQVCS